MRPAVLFAALAMFATPALAGEVVTFKGACDSSAAVALDEKTFLVADDENNILRVYSLDRPGMPLAQFPMGRFLKTNTDKHPEADIEAATRVGDRVYWITSHGRSKKGKWRPSRYLFFATRVVADARVPGGYRVEPVGSPSRDVLKALLGIPGLGPELARAVGRIGADAPGTLAPKEAGLNIEGLAANADASLLYLGLRNPRPGGPAVLVPLRNAAEVVEEGAAPRFDKPVSLDLGGRGVRSIEYSPDHGRYFIVAGSHGGGGDSVLFAWSGEPGAAAAMLEELPGLNPEALAPVAGTRRVQLFSDDGGVMYSVAPGDSIEPLEDGQCKCKSLRDPRMKATRSISRELPAAAAAGGG